MPGRRRKRAPNVYNLEVPLAVAAHSVGAQYLLAAFMKHLVFAREQCHAPFNELENHVQVGCRGYVRTVGGNVRNHGASRFELLQEQLQ